MTNAPIPDDAHHASRSNRKGVVLVTGASSGIGRATAERFASAGYAVYGTSRSACTSPPNGTHMLELDVRDEASVQSCVREVLAHAGTIDVLIANAGEMVFGAIEEVPLDDARRMFDTNFWGAARVVGAALPSMRARGRGRVLLVGSVAGHTAIPMNGYYAASKAALARYAEALRHEVMHLGVHVSLIEPSDYRTRFWDHARIAPSSIEAYARLRDRVLGAVRMLISEAPAPTPVADVLLAAVESNTPRGTYRVGAWANRLPRMRAWMPAVMFEAGVRRRFGLDALHR